MKKEWINPKLKDLKVNETQESDVCLYEDEAANAATPLTLFPVLVWGDGKIGCTYWDCSEKGCTNPNYGAKGKCWPCPQVKVKTS